MFSKSKFSETINNLYHKCDKQSGLNSFWLKLIPDFLRSRQNLIEARLRQIQDIWYGKDVANNLIEWFQAQFVGKLDNRTLVCTNIKLDNYLL